MDYFFGLVRESICLSIEAKETTLDLVIGSDSLGIMRETKSFCLIRDRFSSNCTVTLLGIV